MYAIYMKAAVWCIALHNNSHNKSSKKPCRLQAARQGKLMQNSHYYGTTTVFFWKENAEKYPKAPLLILLTGLATPAELGPLVLKY